jgi:hypothetical protein
MVQDLATRRYATGSSRTMKLEVDKRIKAGFAKEHGMSQDLMCRATTVQQNGSVGSNDSSDSDTGMGSEEPTNEHVLNKENCDNE